MIARPTSLARILVLPLFVLLLAVCTKKEETPEAEQTPEPDAAAPAKLDLWAGVPPLVEEPGDLAETIEPRPGPKKPETVGERIELPFAPEEVTGGPEVPPGTPLEVLRYGPEGSAGLVGAIRVAFNQPMVPLAAVETLQAKPIPLTIDPMPPGKPRWLGTRVLAWEPEGRMPFSTTYEVTVPAGVKSTSGAELAKPVTWSLTTPVLALESSSPYSGEAHVDLQPTLTLVFNQPIEKVALLGAMELRGGGKAIGLAQAPASTTPSADETIEWQEKRTLRLKLDDKLQPDTHYTLKIRGGVYGEGPNPGPAMRVDFTTYPPLRLSWAGCGGTCWATSGITLTATNQITDPDIESKVHVDPPVDELTVSAAWNGITLGGRFEGGKRYKVTVDAGVIDSYGQTLAKPFTKTIKLGPPYPSVGPAVGYRRPAVIEKSGSTDLKLDVAGIRDLELEARALAPEEAMQFLGTYPSSPDLSWPLPATPATWTDKLDVGASMKRKETFTVELSKILGGTGQSLLWLNARSEEVKLYGWKQRMGYNNLFEVTDLGVAAALDAAGGTVLVTRLSTGEPVAGAKISVQRNSYSPETLWTGITDSDGLAQIEHSKSTTPEIIVAHTDDDTAFVAVNGNDLLGGYRYTPTQTDEPRAFIYTDRAPYKPGETIHLAGVLRKETHGTAGGVELWASNAKGTYTVTEPRGIEVAKGEVEIGPFGTFEVDIETDPDGGTGNYSFQLTIPALFTSDRTFYHAIPVETYRTPEFKVSVERDGTEPLVYGKELRADVIGEYLHGAPLVGGEVGWSLTRSETGFTPPGAANREFRFGVNTRWGGMWDGPFGGGPGYYGRGSYFAGGGYGARTLKTGSGTLDSLGKLRIEKDLLAVEPDPSAPKPAPAPKTEPPLPAAATYTINATVTDENRQAIAGTGSFVVHPAAVYVGLRSERQVLKAGDRAELSAIVVDLDGERVPGRDIALTVVRKETTRKPVEKDGRWHFEYDTKEIPAGDCALASANAPAKCEVTVPEAGQYAVRATAKDEGGHEAHTEITLYVHGKDAVVWDDNEQRVDLVPDKPKYAPGDTAVVMLRSPFEEARGIVLVEREGITKSIPVHLEGGAHVVEIPIDETMIPNVSVSAVLTRGRVKLAGVPSDQDLGRPSAASGRVDLKVDDAAKRLVVDLTPSADKIAPGSKLGLQIQTRRAEGDPTKAAVAVMVVDEGVLSLLGYQTPDPMAFFHHSRSPGAWLYALQTAVVAQAVDATGAVATLPAAAGDGFARGGLGLLGNGPGGGGRLKGSSGFMAAPAAEPAPAPPMMDEAAVADRKAEAGPTTATAALDPSAAMAQPVSLRDVFATTAFFDAEVMTDEDGHASLEIDMPENLTTFRIMAVAVDPDHADRFGNGETTVTVRKPIMVRPSLPRFTNFGDHFEASVMVDNLSDEAQSILTGTRGLNVEITGAAEKLVEVPAGESKEVRFSMATEAVGRMRLQFAVMSNAGRDATEITVPVNYPAVAKAFADYGAVDGTTQRVLEPPDDALPDFGGLEVSMSSTALSGLEDAVEYLVTYPYECAEQTASRILPIFALGDIIEEFPIASVADRSRRDALAADGIKRLFTKQNYDGGFGYWGTGESWPYLTNWVTLALLEGKKKGYEVDETGLNNALSYVERFVRYGTRTRWGEYYDWTSRAFGLWLLSGEGRGSDLWDTVWPHRDEIPLYARAQLMAAAHRFGKTAERDALRKEIDDAVVESTRSVHFAENASEADADGLALLMHSDVQTDAIVLMALLETDPSEPMLPKVMSGIMADRDPKRGGRWVSTHANAWALLSASRYYDTVEATEPDFTARIWIDDDFGGEAKFAGRSMDTVDQRVPMRAIQGAAQRDVTLDKDGPGKLYYRLGLRYAPKDLKMKAQDQGFQVYREYEALPDASGKLDPDAVKRTADGTWIVKAGTDVRVTIHAVARDRASWVVIDDALPAGFEGQNPRFVTTGAAPSTASRTRAPTDWWWPWWTFDHTDLRDDRMLLFADWMPAGVYSYSYTARATTIGTFHLPPIKAEAMYEPERFGHSSSGEVQIVE